MGAVCCANETDTLRPLAASESSKSMVGGKASAPPKVEQIKDLPAVKWEGIKDLYERFEKSLPFNRIKIDVMF